MHIHPSSPSSSISEEDAATKIQAGFRGYRVRKQLRQSTNDCLDFDDHLNGRRLKSQKSLDKEKCATKIQARIRGFLVRRKQKAAADAATKIQAGFRGFRARKQLKNLKE